MGRGYKLISTQRFTGSRVQALLTQLQNPGLERAWFGSFPHEQIPDHLHDAQHRDHQAKVVEHQPLQDNLKMQTGHGHLRKVGSIRKKGNYLHYFQQDRSYDAKPESGMGTQADGA